ncbi:MAG: glycosyltransferase family 4 protein [Acidimicrobiales bacterium]
MSLRVGIICPYSLTVPGGVQGQVLALARALRAGGCNARVLGPCDGPPPDSGVTPLGASLPAVANGSIAPIAPDPAAQLRTLRALRDEDFDVIHLHEPLAPGPTMTAVLFRPAPLLATYHAAGGSRAYDYLKPGVRWLARRIDRNYAVSIAAKTMAQNALGGEYQVLFNGVEVPRFRNASPTPTDGPTILFVGRHEPRKGLAVLLEAHKLLADDVRLWIGGEGPETADLRARFAGNDRIDWLGHLTETDKIERMSGATVFCAPSLRGESFGVVLLEAMAAGTPVVASELPGYSKVARGGHDGELVPPGNSVALAKALNRVLGDSRRSSELVDAGFERAEEFSMRRLAATYRAAYEELQRQRDPDKIRSRIV